MFTLYEVYALSLSLSLNSDCGVRLVRTNLTEKDVAPLKEQLAQSLFDRKRVKGIERKKVNMSNQQ